MTRRKSEANDGGSWRVVTEEDGVRSRRRRIVEEDGVRRRLVTESASKVLRDKNLSKAAKTAAGSALTQAMPRKRTMSSEASAAASKVLRDKNLSKAAKTAAGSALTQKQTRKSS